MTDNIDVRLDDIRREWGQWSEPEKLESSRLQITAAGNEADVTLVIDFIHCCSALVSLGYVEPFLGEIEAFVKDERDQVRLVAQLVFREVLGNAE